MTSTVQQLLRASMTESHPTRPPDEDIVPAVDILRLSIQCIVGVIGLIGNLLVCIVFGFLRTRKSQVNLFLFNQALVDLLTSVLLIVFGSTYLTQSKNKGDAMYKFTLQSTAEEPTTQDPAVEFGGEFVCRFWWSRFLLFSSFAVSTYNLTMMSIERYVAVKQPLSYSKYFNRRNTVVLIAFIWTIPPVLQFFPAIFQYSFENDKCVIQNSWTKAAQASVGISIFLWEYFIPCIIMGYVYGVIAKTLHKRKHEIGNHYQPPLSNGNKNNHHVKVLPNSPKGFMASRNTTITLFILFAVFILCWTPNQFTFLAINCGANVSFESSWYHTTVILAFLNSCINPCIYSLRLQKFRSGVKMILTCDWNERPQGSSLNAAETTMSK